VLYCGLEVVGRTCCCSGLGLGVEVYNEFKPYTAGLSAGAAQPNAAGS